MITRLRLWVIVLLLSGVLPSLIAQTFTEQKNTYPLSADGSKYVVNGFIPFSSMNDEQWSKTGRRTGESAFTV